MTRCHAAFLPVCALPSMLPFRCGQLCKTCNSQLYNITADDNNKRTAELTPDMRAQLGGVPFVPHGLACAASCGWSCLLC